MSKAPNLELLEILAVTLADADLSNCYVVTYEHEEAIENVIHKSAKEAILAAVPLVVEMARKQVETYQTKGGYSFNHHKHDKYKDADSIIKALRGEG
jgi:hypothetical protein